MDNEINKETVADKIYGVPFMRLSAWGQRHVEDVVRRFTWMGQPLYTANLRDEDDPAKLSRDNERLASELESVRMENLDLWNENTELKEQLSKIQAQFNVPDDSTL